jgi:YfiR/HmsC-like
MRGSTQHRYRTFSTIVALCLVLTHWRSASGQLSQSDTSELTESEIKASYLYNFARFTEWPGNAANPDLPITLCFLGRDTFSPSILNGFGKKSVGTHPLKVVVVTDIRPTQSCQIIYIGSSEDERAAAIIDGARQAKAMTVGETVKFREAGGMVRLYKESGSVRFEVNVDELDRSSLKLSSKVLGIARLVGRDGKTVPRS